MSAQYTSSHPLLPQKPPLIPPQHRVWGSMKAFTGDALKFLLDARQYGDFIRGRFGPVTLYIASHPDYFRQILVTDAKSFNKTALTKRVLSDTAGNGLFTNDGEPWKQQRKLVQPAFHTQRIAAYADAMVEYANRLGDSWQVGEICDVEHEMTQLTMEIVGKTLFDVDISNDAEELGDVITRIFKTVNKRFDQFFALPRWFPTRENREMKSAISVLDETIANFIREWRKTGEDKGDLLSMLLMAQDEESGIGMTDKQIHDEAITLFVAGHETTANTLIWVWYLLSQYPEIEAKLHQELETVLNGRQPTFADLPKLHYTEMVIKETMRLYPAAWGITRDANENVMVGDYLVKKGSPVLLNVFGVHRDARFFENPDHFEPERFTPENEKLINKYAYIPFGAGPRVCIGNSFSMMESKLIVATLAQRFRLVHDPDHIAEPVRVFTMRPKYGMRMIVEKR